MKTPEQIEAMANDLASKLYDAQGDITQQMPWSDCKNAFMIGYQAAQKDAEEREKKLVEALKFYANNGASLWEDAGGLKAREVLKKIGEIE